MGSTLDKGDMYMISFLLSAGCCVRLSPQTASEVKYAFDFPRNADVVA